MIVDVERHGLYRLPEDFLAPYRDRPVDWGYGALSWVTYKRTYSRDGESWWQTCRRVVEGMITVQRAHCRERGLAFDEREAEAVAREAYRRMWAFKWTPPGRGLWIMGTRFLYESGGAALNNCGFVSTADLGADFAAPFVWMFRMLMLGVGVGFDTRGAGRFTVRPAARGEDEHRVEDSREGWAGALERCLRAFAGEGTLPARWDLSRIRPRGTPLERFGGVASGPEPLARMLADVESRLAGHAGRATDSTLLVDLMNLVGRCVVAGGIRRSAQIAFGRPDDRAFLDLKLDRGALMSHRWASNNSVLAEVGMDYAEVAARTAVNGEPGFLWLENARRHGRLADPPNEADAPALGSNPCMEQTLWDRELCCLVETFPARHASLEDFLRTLDVAYLYAKTVTLVPTGDPRTDAVMARNRRIGCSMTGIVQAISRHGYRRFLDWCQRAYLHVRRLDERYAERFAVPRSIKTTSVKPSGTVSLLAGATPGVHWEHAPYYLRRIRMSSGHPLVELCRAAGYPVEPDAYAEGTEVVTFPVHVEHLDRAKAQVALWEKVDLASRLQHYWSDNQVSCTADFDPAREAPDLARVLRAYEDRLKGIVFLPAAGHGYAQPPYETIDRTRYLELVGRLRPLRGVVPHEHELEAAFCDGAACDLAPAPDGGDTGEGPRA